jgi:hypothetical protein
MRPLRAAGNPCVAAHSTTRALLASYNGPLYQVLRESDGKTLDIGVVVPSRTDAGGYANAAAQDAFCADTICVINVIYDQSGKGNHLYQAAPGTFKGPAEGGFDTQPIADMAAITISGHKAYGVYMIPGMGFRNNNASGLAINDEPEGIYSVMDGTHFDSGCCFDYGNASTNGRAVGPGTMETTYFGTSTVWGTGGGSGPWIMTDMESGMFSGYSLKKNAADPTIDSWRFITAVADGGGGNHWDLRGGNAQQGNLTTFYSGVRPDSRTSNSYYPMHRQGAILLGTGGDNGNGSSGTFYEGVMTSGSPTEATTDAVQANIVAARYDVQRTSLSRLTAFAPGSTQSVIETFVNTTGLSLPDVRLSLGMPAGWTAEAAGTHKPSMTVAGPVAPGARLSASFRITAPSRMSSGFLTGKAEWTDPATSQRQIETTRERVRDAPPIKINEVRFGTSTNPTDQFIEFYNASAGVVDMSNWRVIHTPSEWAQVRLATIPAGTKLASGGFYVLGLANSGLAAPARAGDASVNVRSTNGLAVGQQVNIDDETRTIANVGTAATAMTTLFVPVSTGPWITFPAGSTNLPVTTAAGFTTGEKIGIDIGGNYEIATVTAVGNAGTQTTLAAAASAGATNLKLAADANITAGDTLTVGTGSRKETAVVASVGTTGGSGTGVGLTGPLQHDHMTGVDVSDRGTGINFAPATRFAHRSGDAAQALGSGITLDRPLAKGHAYGSPVIDPAASTAGYTGPVPNQWFGGMLSSRAGSIELLDASGGVIVDAMVYGSQQSNSSGNGTVASPEIATLMADQAGGGCIVVVPSAAPGAGRSVGRFPDGADTDKSCEDFHTQAIASLAAASTAGSTNIKVTSVTDLHPGQPITIDSDGDAETAIIATVGTPGATSVATATGAGATVIPVASVAGFSQGQTITLDSGANAETAVVAAIGRRGDTRITVASPLGHPHEAGVMISGSGIELTAGLARAHRSGAQVAGSPPPTPGGGNRYYKLP